MRRKVRGARAKTPIRYPITEAGAELIRKALSVNGLSLRKLSARLLHRGIKVGYTSLHYVINKQQDSLEALPAVCAELGIDFYKTQPLRPEQIRLLDQFERLTPHGPDAVESALSTFAIYVRGVAGPEPEPPEDDGDVPKNGNGSAPDHHHKAR